ncbi:hypothetical protein LINPERHAP2_LOCUS10012 [Linum perenne]
MGKSFVVLLMCWFMALGHNPITCFELSMKEDKRQERPRKLLNKPRVTSIQTKYGELYDCVDFYQQPAFDHPLLKHHKYKYKMSSSYDQLDDKSSIDPFNIWLNGKGCPANAVPIKRDTKNDIMRINRTTHLAYTNSVNENPGVQVAVLRTNGKNKYYGGAMAACVYRPKVQSTQYSSSRIIVRNGVDSIAAGWTDTKTGDWFLVIGVTRITIGYWPNKIFTSLRNSANYIEWGGEVYNPQGTTPPPQMGSGRLNHNVSETCYGHNPVTCFELSMKQDKRLERPRKLLNKPRVTTIQVAVLRTNGKNKYHGGAMAACVYRPKVQSTQYSSSRIIVRNGVDSIAAGWTVNPSLYRDHEPRMFIYTNTKNSHCYNTYCPGFIITRSDTPLDFVLKPQTVIGGPRFEKYFYIGKDTKNGDWVLVIGATRITMGYWPNKIFTNLRNPANYIEWGGEVYSPQGTPPPQMGSGRINRNISETCFARYVSTVNENHDLDRNPKSCTPYHTSNRYNLIDAGYVTVPIVERLILFGGK